MKLFTLITKSKCIFLMLCCLIAFSSCKKALEYQTYGTFSEKFPANEKEAAAALNFCYTGMVQGSVWSLDWVNMRSQDLATTDEMDCNWGYEQLRSLNFNPDWDLTNRGYIYYVSLISQITLYISKVEALNMSDAPLKARYIGEFKALRGYYSSYLYSHFGPVPIRIKAEEINNPNAPVLPRPTNEEMVSQILSDLSAAIAALPDKATGADYGRFSKASALTCRMKLYMQLKRWNDAIADGETIGTLGFGLIPNYNDNFGPQAKGGNSEIILPIVCTPTASTNVNMWFAYNLANDYKDPEGTSLQTWNGFRMPWATYRKFDIANDERTLRLLRYYPSSIRAPWVWRDALTGDTATSLVGGKITPAGVLNGEATMVNRNVFAAPDNKRGAIAMKYAIDKSGVSSQNMNLDIIVYRYADVLLLLAEAYNNMDQTDKATPLIDRIRLRAGLKETTASSKPDVQTAIENERLFELYMEGTRREDLLRWGKFIQRAVTDGSSSLNPNWNRGSIGAERYKLYPIPRSVIAQSNGVIKQNPGYE